jgi:Holliday junction DNA helicase RuvA
MIAYLKGKILVKAVNHLVLENQGVGFKVFAPTLVINAVRTGAEAALHIHTHVREDQISLFGFLHENELELFEQLISVSGVGPKIALAVMSGASADNIRSAIAGGDASVFTKVSGVGKKTGERIVVELKEKMGELGGRGAGASRGFAEGLDALVALGYTQAEAREAIKHIPTELIDSGSIVKAALRILGGK